MLSIRAIYFIQQIKQASREKGFIILCGEKFKKTHNLMYLLKRCEKINPDFESLREEIEVLNQFYIEARYPGDIPEFSERDAREGIEATKRVKAFVLEKVGIGES